MHTYDVNCFLIISILIKLFCYFNSKIKENFSLTVVELVKLKLTNVKLWLRRRCGRVESWTCNSNRARGADFQVGGGANANALA